MDFRDLMRSDARASSLLPDDELEELFEYDHFVRYVDETFERVQFS